MTVPIQSFPILRIAEEVRVALSPLPESVVQVGSAQRLAAMRLPRFG